MFFYQAWPVLACFLAPVAAKVVHFVEPGFFFDYDESPVPIPVSQQCEVLHLTWGRRQAIGPNPVAPYSLQIYTSTFQTPFLVDAGDQLEFSWAVPFAPGTLYQICMFDVNGVPGGCQDTYAVIPNFNGTDDALHCPNVTFPEPLNITGTVASGPLSIFGFVDQCTDITIKPNAGTPPFTLTIAPPLHPPFNLTSNTMDPITWTVSLSRAMPFFMSMVSSEGLVWAAGPMHSGGFGPTDCLAPGTVNAKTARSTAAGAGVGGLCGGIFLCAMAWLGIALYQRRRKAREGYALDHKIDNNARSEGEEAAVPTLEIGAPMGLGSRYLPSTGYASQPSTILGRQTSVGASTYVTDERPATVSSQQVIVLHRDGGRAPVTVYEEDIVELPPHYVDRVGRPRAEGGELPTIESARRPSLRTLSGPRPRGPKRSLT